uniref:pentatricopeptide repeat-containing protein At2g13600-like n=1 Tax=Erigeron canadensis TaxID=72917 RepID=UPI001CB9A9F7|nr:pentatricopeptide repeat-containing protein At2g13600-like [Erigeron canadensis]
MGSDQNVFVVGALIDMYSKCGDVDEAYRVFDRAPCKNNILWTSMITAFAQSGRGLDALELFDHLVMERRFIPDHVCFTVVLTACNHAGLLDKGIDYFDRMRSEYNLAPEVDQYACLIDLYARKGELKRAKQVMEDMPFDANAVIWSSFLSSCKKYGNVELGREAAYKLFKLEPNSSVPYRVLADIYAGAGLWNDVQNITKLMNDNGVRKTVPGWSWVEVDNQVLGFSVGDASHPRSEEIHLELRKLSLEMLNKRTLEYIT